MRRLVAALLVLAPCTAPAAQGVSTAGIRGSVRTSDGRSIEARVRVSHDATGFAVDVRVAGSRFLVQGLEPGGSYTVDARALGYAPQRRTGVLLRLGELHEVDFVLAPLAARLDTIAVAASIGAQARGDGGTRAIISEALLDRLPTPNRDLHDFVRLVPQISTKISLSNPGVSAAGMGFRFNNFLINNVSERTPSGGVSNAFAGMKSIPLGAVHEYQVLLAPYDVRYGDFGGALVNAATKSGTNTFRGSVFAFARHNRLAKRATGDSTPPYEKVQYGFSVGGPIIPSRLHFFIAPELQHFTYPADGPYVGQPSSAGVPVPVRAADLDRFDGIMNSHSLTAGTGGPIENGNPLVNLFTRLDLALPAVNSRVIAWNNYAGSESMAFSRGTGANMFSLSSYQATSTARARTSAVHVHTALAHGGGGHNELLVSHRAEGLQSVSNVNQPIIRVWVPSLSGGRVLLNAGTPETAHGGRFRSLSVSVKDILTLPLGAGHVVTVGAEAERFRIRRDGVNGAYGTWTFASLDDFARGTPERYDVGVSAGNTAPLRGTQYSVYAGDQWQVRNDLSLTGGVRADLLAIDGGAPYNRAIDSIFGRRTDRMPRQRIELSPRVGFVWDLDRVRQQRIRGGVGLFTGRHPLAWSHTALTSYGVGGGVLSCNLLGSPDRYPPPFTTNHHAPPTVCGGGYQLSPSTDVDVLDPDLRMLRVARGSLAYERNLPWGLISTTEALATRALSDFVFMNLNLAAPVAIDPYGRVMYGVVSPAGTVVQQPNPRRSTFGEVIELRNTGRNHSMQLSARLEKTQSSGLSGFASYTYSRTRDVQTPIRVNNRGTVAWASARATGGRHDDLSPSISANDIPHRVILGGTAVGPWSGARTELSFYYVGESGRPFTYLAFGRGIGDLNADGSNANDPVYIPHSALDTTEILFSGVSDSAGADNSPAAQASRESSQRAAFERFVASTSCLRRQRGRIMARNSCREPWSNTTIASVRQAVPVRGRGVELQLDVFNVLNLMNPNWGLRREAVPGLLDHFRHTQAPVATARPIFRYHPGGPRWTTLASESAFQLQLAARYRF